MSFITSFWGLYWMWRFIGSHMRLACIRNDWGTALHCHDRLSSKDWGHGLKALGLGLNSKQGVNHCVNMCAYYYSATRCQLNFYCCWSDFALSFMHILLGWNSKIEWLLFVWWQSHQLNCVSNVSGWFVVSHCYWYEQVWKTCYRMTWKSIPNISWWKCWHIWIYTMYMWFYGHARISLPWETLEQLPCILVVEQEWHKHSLSD